MIYTVKKKIPKKHDFTQNRWPAVLPKKTDADEVMFFSIKEIDEDTKKLNEKYDAYCNFIKKFNLLDEKRWNEYVNYKKFIEEKFKRTSKQVEHKELLFFKKIITVHDNYFENNETKKLFFGKAKNIISNLKELYLLYREFYNLNDMSAYKFFFPKDHNDKVKCGPLYMSDHHFPFNVEYTSDLQTFTDLTRKEWMGHSSFNSKACTPRTYEFYKSLFNLGLEEIVNIYGNITPLNKVEIPCLPTEGYARWYFDKIIDENNRIRRKVELYLRSKKRARELATNLNSVYIMSSEDLPKDSYKIGWTSNLPEERAEELSGTSVLNDYKVEYSKKFKDAEKIEKQVHEYFKEFRIKKNKEIFKLKIEKIIKYIENIK